MTNPIDKRPYQSSSLAGLTALVTGAARGIGQAIAIEFIQQGANVLLADVAPPEETLNKIRSLTPKPVQARAEAIAMDVTNEDQVTSICQQMKDRGTPISIAVNNAGIMQKLSANHHTLPMDDLRRMLDVHVIGSAIVCKAVIPAMRESKFGRIINLSSVLGLVGLPRRTAYSTAKAAITGLTQGLALENGRHGITVNAVAPGYVLTDVLKEKMKLGTLDYDLYANRAAVGRWAEPCEIARVISFLADPASGFITGAIWPVDGGYACNGNPGEPL